MADSLTRTVLALIQELPKPIDFDVIADTQEIDPETKSLSNAITSLQLKLLPVNNSYKKILCDVSQNEPRVILPPSFKRKAFDMIHSLNHAGIKSTLYMIKQKFFWPNINKDIKNLPNINKDVKNIFACVQMETIQIKRRGHQCNGAL